MKKDVLLIRHPEIERGAVASCYGHTDLSLTPRGVLMIEGLIARAQSWQPEVVLSSDLQRCRQPAEAISQACGIKLELNPAWREIFMGQWENQPWADLQQRYPEKFIQVHRDYVKVSAPDGESYEQMADRTFGVLRSLEAWEHQRIWVMTHGGPIRAVVSRILGLPLAQSWALETAYAAGVLVRWTGEDWKVIFC